MLKICVIDWQSYPSLCDTLLFRIFDAETHDPPYVLHPTKWSTYIFKSVYFWNSYLFVESRLWNTIQTKAIVNSTASTRTPPSDVPKTTCVDILYGLLVAGFSVVRGNLGINVGVISSGLVVKAVVGSVVTNGVVALVTIGSGVVVIISRTSVRVKDTKKKYKWCYDNNYYLVTISIDLNTVVQSK